MRALVRRLVVAFAWLLVVVFSFGKYRLLRYVGAGRRIKCPHCGQKRFVMIDHPTLGPSVFLGTCLECGIEKRVTRV